MSVHCRHIYNNYSRVVLPSRLIFSSSALEACIDSPLVLIYWLQP